MTSLFEQLIRVGIGQQDCLTRTPSAEEWEQLHELCYEQSLLGVGYLGVSIVSASPEIAQNLSRAFLLKWHIEAEEIKAQNQKLYRKCVKLERRFGENGCRVSILKGQSLAAIYQNGDKDLRMLRQSGDIDLWMDGGREHCLRFLREKFGPFRFDYKHGHPDIYSDLEVEVHWIPEICTNVLTNRKLMELWTAENANLSAQCVELPDSYGCIHTPEASLNAFYVLLHCYRHFMLGGIGMKQVMDSFFLLKKMNAEGREKVMLLVERFDMTRFVAALMWILLDVFRLDRGLLLCNPDEKEGRFVLQELYHYGHSEGQNHNRQSTLGPRGPRYIYNTFRNLYHIGSHYPKEALWGPVWIVYHFGWKIWHKLCKS